MAEAAARVTDGGHRVLFGACDEALAVPGRPLADALRPYLAAHGATTLREQLGHYRRAIGSLLPEFADHAPGESRQRVDDPAEEQALLLDGLVHLLRQASAATPLLLVLDDLHWADELTLLATRQLQRAEDLSHVAVFVTYRHTEPPTSRLLGQLIADAARRTGVTRVELGPLGVEDVAVLAGPHGPPAGQLHAVTDGNPFFVSEVLNAVAADVERFELSAVPAGVREMVRVRLARMSVPTTRLLATAALLGREFRVDALLAICIDRAGVLDALEDGEQAHFVRSLPGASGAFAFAHALVMRTLADDLPATLRMRIHERIALTLADDARTAAAEVAYHFREAAPLGHDDQALRWTRAAGDEAMASLAFASAAEHYGAALEIQPRLGRPALADEISLRVAHGRALRLAGASTALQVLVDAAVAAERAGELELMAEALLAISLAYATEVAADTPVADLLRRSLDQLRERDGPTRARLLSFLAMETLHALDRERPESLATQARAMARRSGNPVATASALVASVWAALHPAAVRERERWADELIELAQAHRLPFYACMGYAFRYHTSLEQGDRAAATAALDAAASTPGQSSGRWVIAINRAGWTLLTAPLDVAERQALAAFEVGHDAGIEESVPAYVYGAQLVCIRTLQGRLPELDGLITQFAAAQPLGVAWQALLGRLRCAQGRPDDAREALRAGTRVLAHQPPSHAQWSAGTVLLAGVACELGEHSACRQLYALLRPFSELLSWSGAFSLGPFALSLARLAAALDHRTAAERHARYAIALSERMGAVGFAAVARRQLAKLLPPGVERDQLEAQAHDEARRIGIDLATFG